MQFKFVDKTETAVRIITDLGDKDYIPKNSRMWFELGVDEALLSGKVHPCDEKEYHVSFEMVDDKRRSLYLQIVDPLMSEANVKEIMAFDEENTEEKSRLTNDALELRKQAVAARKKIQNENPYPAI